MFFLLFLFFLLSVLFFFSSHHHQTFNIFDRFWFTAKESTMTRFVVRTWWITLCWSLDIRQPNGSWRIGGAMDGEKMDTCVWQKIKIDAALRIMRHTQKFNSMYINWRKKKKKKEKRSILDFRFPIIRSRVSRRFQTQLWEISVEISKSRTGESVSRYFYFSHTCILLKYLRYFAPFEKRWNDRYIVRTITCSIFLGSDNLS